MEKFELSMWKDEYPNRADFSTLLSGKSGSQGINILSKRDDVEKVTSQDQLLANNTYIVLDDNETGEKWYWQVAYYTDKRLKGYINNFEKANTYTINSPEYCAALKEYLDKTGRREAGQRLFPQLYQNPIGQINTDNRYSYYFINEQGLLCATDALGDKEIWVVKNSNNEDKILILANENMDLFLGRIYNIHFIRNIDGTKSVTFEVPKYYDDLLTGERKSNEYLDYLHLKTKLKLHYRDEWYTFLVNSKEEKKSRSGIYYSFEANDLAQEELSKIGYTLNFTADPETIELCGAGTAKELTERILVNSGWEYNEVLTNANMQEYEEKVVYNPLTAKYENKRIPVVTYKKHYSPFLKQYVNETNMFAAKQDSNTFANYNEFSSYIDFMGTNKFFINKTSGWQIYCYDKSDIITTGSTPNLIASNSEFVSLDDWDVVNDNLDYSIVKVNDDYCLQLTKNGAAATSNFTSVLGKGNYLIKVETPDGTNSKYNIQINSNSKTLVSKSSDLTAGNYYVFSLSSGVGSMGEFIISSSNGITIKSIILVKLEVQDTVTGDSVIINYNQHKGIINSIISSSPQRFYDNKLEEKGLTLILPDTVVAANSKIVRTYFIEPYSTVQEAREVLNDDTLEETDEWIIELPQEKVEDYLRSLLSTDYQNYTQKSLTDLESLSADSIEEEPYQNNNIYLLTDKYNNFTIFVSQKFTYGENDNYEWVDLGLKSTSEKTRLITGDRSNTFTFLQDVAEKFKVYVDFKIVHEPETGKIVYYNGQPKKYVYYTDRLGKKLYNGIIDTVNLSDITRKIDSNELITKMYVENIESEYNDDGYISIQLSSRNPSRENYIYNFKHYLNIGQLDNTFVKNLNNHNAALKTLNEKYLDLSEDFNLKAEELSKQESYVYSLNESKVAAENTLQELLKELCNTFEGTYSPSSSANFSYINSNKFSSRYNMDKKALGSKQDNKQLNYTFRLPTTETINNKSYVLVGDFDWVLKGTKTYIWHLNKQTNVTQDSLYKKIQSAVKTLYNNTHSSDGFYYDDITQQTYYFYNYSPSSPDNLRIKYVRNYFYIKESDFTKEFESNKWTLNTYRNACFAPKLLGSIAQAKIEAYNLTLGEIYDIKNKLSTAENELSTIQKEYDALSEEMSRLLKAKNSMITTFENKYIQFIKEGYWSSNEYNDNDTYYLDALSVSNESALPKVEYTINIVDLSSIKGYEDFTFDKGDETFIIDRDIFGYDTSGKPLEERIVITEIDTQLDQNSNNKISLKTYSSRFEDLFSRITASVTAVQSNSYQWDKASILNADGSIPSSLLTTINTNNNALVNSSIGALNTYSLDAAGLVFISQVDTNYKMKANSVGIFFTETANQNTQWTLGISARGVNASAITSGTINTNQVTVSSEYSPSQIWNSLGLTMYSAAGIDQNVTIEEDSFVRADKHGFYLVQEGSDFGLSSDGVPWFYGMAFADSLEKVKEDAKVSITRDGFIYNSNPGSKQSIKIGNLGSEEGIRCTDSSGNIYFEAYTNGSSSNARIANFKFNNSKMWYNTVSDNNKAYTTKGSFVIDPVNGLFMQNVKLLTSGAAYFGNVYLTGGEINSTDSNNPVKIKKAMLGPFRFDGSTTSGYMYGKASGSKMISTWNSLNMSGKTVTQITRSDHDFYLGTATLTKTDLSNTMSAFPNITKNLSSSRFGILLSLGNDFWIHSAGYGKISGNILIDGKVHIRELDTDSLSIGGSDFVDLLDKYSPEVTQVINNYISNPSNSSSLGVKNGTVNDSAGVYLTLYNGSPVDSHNKKQTLKNVPSLRFYLGGRRSIYIIAYKNPHETEPSLYVVTCNNATEKLYKIDMSRYGWT